MTIIVKVKELKMVGFKLKFRIRVGEEYDEKIEVKILIELSILPLGEGHPQLHQEQRIHLQ